MDFTLSQPLVLSVSQGLSGTPMPATPRVLPHCLCSCFPWRAPHPSSAAQRPYPGSREPARAPQGPVAMGQSEGRPGSVDTQGGIEGGLRGAALRRHPQCGLCEAWQARAERELSFFPQERLFNLKIIECGKCWIWKLFIRFPLLFLPLAVPAVVGGGAWAPKARLCRRRAAWGSGGRAWGAVTEGPQRARALGGRPGRLTGEGVV